METIINFFSINTVFFTILGYQMSYLEFFGIILNLCSVYLVTKNKIWTWPIGNIAVVLFAVLFFQIQLYSDFIEQIYFFITGFYGWWVWLNLKKDGTKKEEKDDLPVSYNSPKNNLAYIAIIFIGTIVSGFMMNHIHEWIPTIFFTPASFPYMDAFTTVMSFAATILMAHKKIESWYLWILVDVIGIWLYFAKGVIFISILYVIFLILATKGLFSWKKLAIASRL